ncbi:MAG: MBL fold metallo-hydrolase [Verrucomicrobia bacterium]|nr:MBL fold metallo-hydrolase [Verrucomicrobiota bacterium]
MIFKSLCRHAEIGANSYLLETATARIVLDAGMHPKHEGAEAIPHYEMVEDGSIDSAIITHSHLDHVGTLPILLELQPQAKVFLSQETADLALALLHNSVNVMQSKRIELGLAEYPLFEHRDLDELRKSFERRGIERPFDVDAGGSIRATFHDAGHILGSVGVTLEAEGKRILYTGDVNFEDATLQKGAVFPEVPVDAIIVETTRGNHARRPDYTRVSEEDAFAEAIDGVLARKGSVLIPVFAIGKTQEILAMIHRFKRQHLIPRKTPVYIGGLSTKMTHIFDHFSAVSRRKLPGFEFLTDMEIETGTRRNRGPIPFVAGCIYALSSGMMTEKTVSNNFARQGVLENRRHGLFFVGYADPASPGGRIREAKPGDQVLLDPAYPPVPLRCEMRIFDFSGHSTREAIADYIEKVRPKQAFLVHGDEPAIAWFRQELTRRLPATEVIVPAPGDAHRI